jgi:protein TonB
MGIAVLITAALLPIMAWLGVFKAVKERYYAVTMVNLPPPKPLPKVAKPQHKKVASKSHSEAHSNERRQEAKAKPLPFHVAAAAPTGGNSTGPAIVNGTNTNIGTVPTAPPAPAPAPPPAPAPTAPPAPTPAPAPPPQVAQAPPPPAPAPTPVDPQVVYDPRPTIPNDLLGSDLDTNFWALFTIHTDGTADVKMLQSTGNEELDQIAIQCAKEWKFKPATLDGKPVESYERLDVQFQVTS